MKNELYLLTGLLAGTVLFGGPAAAAAGNGVSPSPHSIYVDGCKREMEAYSIAGNNYVKLRDIGEAVGFNVYWDRENGCVQVESDQPYSGEAPSGEETERSSELDTVRTEIIDRTNAIRQEEGISLLTADEVLTQAAQVRAEEMAAAGTYSHTRPDGRPYYTVTDCPYMAENVHRVADWTLVDQALSERVVADWAASPEHSRNLKNPKLARIGIGLARGTNENGDPCWYCVQLFLYQGNTVQSVDSPAKLG